MVAVPVRQLPETSIESLRVMSQQLSRTLTAEPAALGTALPAAAEHLDPELGSCVPHSLHGVLVLRGMPFPVNQVGPTPLHWGDVAAEHTDEWAAQLLLLASVLGRPLGWEGQQDGRLVHEVVPTQGQEQDQTGASSSVELSPHTEDAFHPARADLLVLSCVRNPDRVATYLACIRHT
ncbi:MAG: oxygenase, partial [Actinomycetota bacterium]|nr:oxygenase [Actinomycetota bacterium]